MSPTRLTPFALVLALSPFAGCASRSGSPEPPPPGPARTSPVTEQTPVAQGEPTPLADRRVPHPENVVRDPELFGDLEWHWIGPARGGRVTAVTGVHGQPGTYYFGATGGGVWKTVDYGASWQNLSDGWFETPSIGGIRVAESNPDVVWVSTGSDGLRSNVITGLGVYRSTDAGATWRFLGLRDIGNTGAIEVDPRDPDVAYVAAIGHPFGPNSERGLYRTRDGGAEWEKVLFISDSTGIVDVEIDPSAPDVLYASSWRAERKPWTIISGAREGGVYKSTDGGDTWMELAGGLPTGDGDLFGKIDLAVSRSDPGTVYALIEAPEPNDGLWRSDDAGATWTHVSSNDRLTARAFYYTNVDVDPTDPETLWVNAHVPLFRSTDGGRSWHTVSTPHGDNHDIWIDPSNPDLIVQGNDGGANVSRDGGRSWSSQLNQPTAELYSVDLDDRFPYWAYSGQQDRSAVGVASRPVAVGGNEVSLGCETGPAVPKPGDPDVIYNSCKGRFMVWDRATGASRNYYVGAVYMYGHPAEELPYRMQRVTPIEVSPHDPDRVYYGTQYVMLTEDGGRSWRRLSGDLTATPPGTQGVSGEPITRDITGEEVYSTIYAIEESPVRPGVIWVGSYDGPFHVTRDDGETWREITPPGLEPGGRVQSIDPSPHDPATAIYSVMRFMFDDWRPYVYRTRDYGESWELLTDGTNGIPADYPVRVTREDPVRPGLLYAGTEFGFYVSFDDGAHWQPLQLDLPAVPVTGVAFRDDDLVVSTMGRGFQVLRNLTPLRQLDDRVAAAPAHFYPPPAASLTDWRTRGRDRTAVTPEYGEPGAVLDWVLATEPGSVRVELRSPDGRLINSWQSPGPDGRAVAQAAGDGSMDREEGMRLRPGVSLEGKPVPASAGHTRFVMPLEHRGAWRPDGGGVSGDGGPALSPGKYRIDIHTPGWTGTRSLTVTMDPRVERLGITTAELEEQERLALAVRDLLSRARQLVARVEDAMGDAEGEEADRLEALHRRLTEREDVSYPQPMLVEQIDYLYDMITETPQALGRDAFERHDTLAAELSALEREL